MVYTKPHFLCAYLIQYTPVFDWAAFYGTTRSLCLEDSRVWARQHGDTAALSHRVSPICGNWVQTFSANL